MFPPNFWCLIPSAELCALRQMSAVVWWGYIIIFHDCSRSGSRQGLNFVPNWHLFVITNIYLEEFVIQKVTAGAFSVIILLRKNALYCCSGKQSLSLSKCPCVILVWEIVMYTHPPPSLQSVQSDFLVLLLLLLFMWVIKTCMVSSSRSLVLLSTTTPFNTNSTLKNDDEGGSYL